MRLSSMHNGYLQHILRLQSTSNSLVARSVVHRRARAARSGEEIDTPSYQAIHRTNDLDLAVLFQAGQHIAVLTYRAHGQEHIGLGYLVNKFTVFAGARALVMRRVHRRLDL